MKNNRNKIVGVRLTEKEKIALERLAHESYQNVSTFVRNKTLYKNE